MAQFQDIKTDYEDFWLRSNNCWQSYFRNAQIALKSYAGNSWTQNEIQRLQQENRVAQEFNIIRPQIQLFSGFARDNIKSTIVAPIEDGDQETADQLTEVLKFVYEKADANAVMLNAFDDCLKTGISLVGLYMDYSKDPVFGDIKLYKRSFSSFIVDPDWEKPDFSDASEVLLRDFVTRADAKAMLPFVDPKIIDDIPSFSSDNKFTLLRNNQKFFKNKDILSYDQYYRKTTKKIKQIVDIDTGIAIPFGDKQDLDFLQEKLDFAKQVGVNAEIIESNKQVVELNILLTGQVVYQGPDPVGLDDYPFAPVICHFEPQLNDFALKLQGIALGLVDTQRAFNKRMIRKEDTMDSVVNTGFIYKVGEVDVEDISQSGSGKMIPVNSTLPFSEVIQPIQQGAIPPGWQEETIFLQDLSLRIAGVNESLMGVDDGGNTQISGRLAEVRAANGLRANRSIFDNFERSQKYMGSKVLRAIQKNYGPGKIKRILQKDPTEQFFNQEFDRFDAVIKQAVLSQTQRDSFYFELLKLVEIFGPDKIPASLVLDNIPMAGASEVQKAIEKQEQQAQQQQQAQAQVIEQDRKRAADLTDSVTLENIANAQAKRAKIQSDLALGAERISESEQNRAQAALDRAKTITEIASMKDDRIMRIIEFVRLLESEEMADREGQRQKVMAEAQQVIDSTNLDEVQQQNQLPEQALNAQQFENPGGLDGNV